MEEALESKDHHGRLQGQSKFFTPTMYYTTRTSSNDEFSKLRSECSAFQALMLKSRSASIGGLLVHDSGKEVLSIEEDGATNQQEKVHALND